MEENNVMELEETTCEVYDCDCDTEEELETENGGNVALLMAGLAGAAVVAAGVGLRKAWKHHKRKKATETSDVVLDATDAEFEEDDQAEEDFTESEPKKKK